MTYLIWKVGFYLVLAYAFFNMGRVVPDRMVVERTPLWRAFCSLLFAAALWPMIFTMGAVQWLRK